MLYSKALLASTLLSLTVSSDTFGQTVTDRLSPKNFLQLEERTSTGLQQISLDPVVTYISATTNIRISFVEAKVQQTLSEFYVPEIKERLRNLKDSMTRIKNWKDRVVDSLKGLQSALSDSAKADAISREIDSVFKRYKEERTPFVSELNAITKQLPQADITIQARVTLHTGKQYDLSVPGYTVADSQSTSDGHQITTTSVSHAHYRLTGEGVIDDLADTELDLLSARLGADDMVKLIVTNHYGTVARVYEMNFLVTDFGWKLEFPVSLIFVKRISEVMDSTGKPVNPSNFKPAPGGSMLLTYQPMGGVTKKLFCGFGVGLNAALVNFDLGKDFQLGIGPVVYYLNRSIGVGYGWDLNTTVKREYWFLSLDFLKTFDTFSVLFQGQKGS